MSIAENLSEIKSALPPHVTLVAVSKTKPVTDLMEAYNAGQRIFGENRVQEITEKQQQLPPDIEWHFIGHLQTNKVKYIAPIVSLIHSIDSYKLLAEVDKQARKNNRTIDCLLQFFIAQEESKFGFDIEEAMNLLNSSEFAELRNIRICGVMGMATYTDNEIQIREEFANLKRVFLELKKNHFSTNENFKEISMGMTDDFQIAIEEGSTMVRIGNAIFGARGGGM